MVGKKYPGSTGGEFFNYYGTDSNKNIASGNYSTTIGRKNKTSGNYGFTGGVSNTNSGNGTLMFGSYNSSPTFNPPSDCIVLGLSNTLSGPVKENYMLGHSLNSSLNYLTIIGSYNAAPTVSQPRVILASGLNQDNKQNGIEIGIDCTKILLNLQLANDNTEVNAITPPQDPDNVTADDQTLVTKSFMTNTLGNYIKSQVAYFSDYDSAISIPLDGTSVDFTTFGTKPAWAQRALVTFRWENELIEKEIHFTRNEGIHLYVVQQAYSTFPDTIDYKHLRLEWDYTNQTLTAAGFWTYNQDMANSGAISGWDRTLTNASTCKILSVVYSE